MAKLNVKPKSEKIYTHEGAPAMHVKPLLELKRSVCSCLLWENEFYEDGVTISDRIKMLVNKVHPNDVAELAIQARSKYNLRHVPLLLARELARNGYKKTAPLIEQVVQRADEITEFLAIYFSDGKCPVSAQVKKGLGCAFGKFNEYQLAKYNRKGAITLKDAMRIVHPKPMDDKRSMLYKKVITGTLETPDTWEVALSAGCDKKAVFTRLIDEKKLGGLALLRNLRNMVTAGVKSDLITNAILSMNTARILPFRFIAAAKYAPDYETALETAMMKNLAEMDKLEGRTAILVDVSGSMNCQLSEKSDMDRIDAACGLAILLREICEDVMIYTFSNKVVKIPPRHGFALSDAIDVSQPHSCTYLGRAIQEVMDGNAIKPDRLVIITDEQSHDLVHFDYHTAGYLINVASYKNGVGYGKVVHIDGFSESVVRFIMEYENM